MHRSGRRRNPIPGFDDVHDGNRAHGTGVEALDNISREEGDADPFAEQPTTQPTTRPNPPRRVEAEPETTAAIEAQRAREVSQSLQERAVRAKDAARAKFPSEDPDERVDAQGLTKTQAAEYERLLKEAAE